MIPILNAALVPLPVPPPGGTPALLLRPAIVPDPGSTRRTKIWEFNTNLHCSIIGTCLSTGELRQVLGKLGLAPAGATDHELHHVAVARAGRHDQAAKLLGKALDARHKLAISQFAKARGEDGLRDLWRDAVRRGDIPGAYWATLTHHATSQTLVREAFGDVHMLSHLVGAANRADIRRLRDLETEKADLTARLDRQQVAFHESVVRRDAEIQGLRRALTHQIATEPNIEPPAGETDTLTQLIASLERRLAHEATRREVAESRLMETRTTLATEREARIKAQRDADALRRELRVAEGNLITGDQSHEALPRLTGLSLLYVGGRPTQIGHLRQLGEERGATVLHHDGGIEHHSDLLTTLTRRADVVLFSVDCVSHEAVLTVKRVCRQAGKRFIPLRSASTTAFLAALYGLGKGDPHAAPQA